jgi:hypothetical protein
MIGAGTALGDLNTILLGKRECFFARPNEPSMLHLLDEAILQNTRSRELAVLASITADAKEANTINRMLKEYADESRLYFGYYTEPGSSETKPKTKSSEEIKKGLTGYCPPESNLKKYLAWADKIGQSRIEHIVSNKHRRAYDRAAQVLGALMETYSTIGEKSKAKELFTSFYHEKFNRFSAFRKEVKWVVSLSQVLKKLNLQI